MRAIALTSTEDDGTMGAGPSASVAGQGDGVGRIRWLAVAIGLALGSWHPAAAADAYPSRPIRVLVGFAAGGVADITIRMVGQHLSERLGQAVVIDNRPGAGGIIATEAAATAPPDGYTLMLLTNGTAITQSLFKSLPFNAATDFAPISLLGQFDIVVLAASDTPFHSIADVIAAARAKPGTVTIGTVNPGSTQHLSAELFTSLAGIDAVTVPFRTTPAVIAALLGGEVQVGFEMLAPVKPQIEAGALRALAVSSDHRFPRLPAVPTVQESGLPDYQVSAWNALAAPARTPPAVIERLQREIAAVLEMADVRQSLLDLGVQPRGSSPEAAQRLLVAEIAKWHAVIQHAGIEPQ
jgi:tripartite-type tricarboxylate transporter receptor subunit TctC